MKRVEGTEELKNKVFKSQRLKNSRLQRVFPNSVSGNNILANARLNPVLTSLLFVFVLLIGFGSPGGILAQNASEDSEVEEALSGFDDEESADEDDALSGFDDGTNEDRSDEETGAVEEEESWKQAFSSLSGSTGFSASYSYAKDAPADGTKADWSGLTKLRPYFSLTWDAKLGINWKTRISGKAFYDLAYGMKESETFSEEVLNELEK
ncbi:MAG: hypothetical protein QGF14_01915, partial [SAR324 cluster bacterium]|nr:hypothetical protein [SAR324 cluster bacterium]